MFLLSTRQLRSLWLLQLLHLHCWWLNTKHSQVASNLPRTVQAEITPYTNQEHCKFYLAMTKLRSSRSLRSSSFLTSDVCVCVCTRTVQKPSLSIPCKTKHVLHQSLHRVLRNGKFEVCRSSLLRGTQSSAAGSSSVSSAKRTFESVRSLAPDPNCPPLKQVESFA